MFTEMDNKNCIHALCIILFVQYNVIFSLNTYIINYMPEIIIRYVRFRAVDRNAIGIRFEFLIKILFDSYFLSFDSNSFSNPFF